MIRTKTRSHIAAGAPRDSQRSKVYAAERAVAAGIYSGHLPTMDEVQVYVTKIEEDRWFQRTFGNRRFLVKDGRGRSAAGGGGGAITLPVHSRTPRVILHEVAHCLAGRRFGRGGGWHAEGGGHGWKFCSIYLQLVRHFMGKDCHDMLKASMKKHRVRFTEPRTRQLTDEQRQALRDRMAQVRLGQRLDRALTVVGEMAASAPDRNLDIALARANGA